MSSLKYYKKAEFPCEDLNGMCWNKLAIHRLAEDKAYTLMCVSMGAIQNMNEDSRKKPDGSFGL
jgi:hypothetical protein